MPTISTNNPPDPAVLAELQAIQVEARRTKTNTDELPKLFERLIEAVKEITDR